MFTRLEIDNFKSLMDFSIDLSPMTVIIGNNAAGKSSVLQAIDFLCNCVREDFSVVIERRGWKVENIKSKFATANSKIRFKSKILLPKEENREYHLSWELDITAFSGKNAMSLYRELLRDEDTNEILLNHTEDKGGYILTPRGKAEMPVIFEMGSSFLKLITKTERADVRIVKFKHFLEKSVSFELLSPAEMRLSSRGSADNIGMSGKNLPSFIKKMNEEQKESFMQKLDTILDGRIKDVAAQTKGKPGWTQIYVEEQYKNRNIRVSSRELSDGMLRVLAFVAISEMRKNEAVLLLDEIENGINTNYAEKLLKVLGNIYKETQHQLILTTHSTVFLDYVDRNSIIYLYRDEEGRTKALKLFGNKTMQEQLEYMWPGEVILNMSQSEILENSGNG